MQKFNARLELIGINPFVFVPKEVLAILFQDAKKDKGHIPIYGTINGKKYIQTLVKFSGEWRLYINTTMLSNSPKRIGEIIEITVQFDPKDRTIQPHPRLVNALKSNEEAQEVFNGLSPSKQKEIIRYISFLKNEDSIEKNINKVIGFLMGNNSFLGRRNL